MAEGSRIRIMPDVHSGKGCVIGTTMTINDKVVPNYVGVDIGCGILVCKVKTTNPDLPKLDKIIRQYVPAGREVHSQPVVDTADFYKKLRCKGSVDIERAILSCGTLGGGNHFVELDRGKDGFYLCVHFRGRSGTG